MEIQQKYINKFWNKIKFPENINDCWFWIGYIHPTSHCGIFTHYKKQFSAKAFSYIIHNNFTLVNGSSIIQMCDNILCVNPKHLQIHNMTGTREHKFYEDMVSRILRPNHEWYRLYGGRGIDIDPRYNPDLFNLKGVAFLNLYNDLKQINLFPIPDNYSIDRIDNDKGYWKDNLRLATWEEQSQNRSNGKFNTDQIKQMRLDIKNMSYYDVSMKYGCHETHVRNIVKRKHW